jgi:hypothetical protein
MKRILFLPLFILLISPAFAQKKYSNVGGIETEYKDKYTFTAKLDETTNILSFETNAPVTVAEFSTYTPEELAVRKGKVYTNTYTKKGQTYSYDLTNVLLKDQYAYWLKLYLEDDRSLVAEYFFRKIKAEKPVSTVPETKVEVNPYGDKEVYVAGYEKNGTKDVAKVWKNGVATSLANGSNDAQANSVFVSGTDVYAAGYEKKGEKFVAKVWKNGVATTLTKGPNDARANSVYVSGTNVYVAGYESNGTKSVAKVWKNGVAVSLTNGSNDAIAYSVFVSGIDVYVAGYEKTGPQSVAKVWKNGVATSLTNGSYNGHPSITYSAQAKSVYVSSTDVYVAGYERNGGLTNIAKVWKNGVATSLSPNSKGCYPGSVYVSGTDVYVAGSENIGVYTGGDWYSAIVWKNGVSTALTNYTRKAEAFSVYVSGEDVYVAGEEKKLGKYIAKVWKNGVAIDLTNGANDAGANAVFVK